MALLLCTSVSDSWDFIVLFPQWQLWALDMNYFPNSKSNHSKQRCKTTCRIYCTRVAKCWNIYRSFSRQPVSEWQNQRGGVWLRSARLCSHSPAPTCFIDIQREYGSLSELIEEYSWDLKSQPWHITFFTVHKSCVEREKTFALNPAWGFCVCVRDRI